NEVADDSQAFGHVGALHRRDFHRHRLTRSAPETSTGPAESTAPKSAAAKSAAARTAATSLVATRRVRCGIRISAPAFEVPHPGTCSREDDDDDNRPFHMLTVLALGCGYRPRIVMFELVSDVCCRRSSSTSDRR